MNCLQFKTISLGDRHRRPDQTVYCVRAFGVNGVYYTLCRHFATYDSIVQRFVNVAFEYINPYVRRRATVALQLPPTVVELVNDAH